MRRVAFAHRLVWLVALCLFLALPARSNAALAYVNSGVSWSQASTSSLASSSFNATAGNHIVCGIRWTRDSGQNVAGVTDTASNTYTQVAVSPVINGAEALAVYYAENIAGSASNSVTVSFSANAAYVSIVCIQHSGVTTASGYDTGASAQQPNGITITSSAFTTTQADSLIVGFAQQSFAGTETWNASASATLRATDSANVLAAQSEFTNSIQTSATRSMSTTNVSGVQKNLIVAVFKAAPDDDFAYYNALPLLTDNPWNAVATYGGPAVGGWYYTKRSFTDDDPPDVAVVTDMTAPQSCCNVLDIDFFGTDANAEPGTNWTLAIQGKTEIYAEWWMKADSTWTCPSAGCGKIQFAWPTTGGDMWLGFVCDTVDGSCSSSNQTPFKVAGQLQWPGFQGDTNAPYGGNPLLPNVSTFTWSRSQWVKLASYLKWETTPGVSRDGIWRVWKDNVLQIERTDLTFPNTTFSQWEFAMTKQQSVTTHEHMYIDHVTIRGQ